MTHDPIWTRSRMIGEPAFIGGHRGASLEAAENSREAFQQAISLGADFIEFDWRLTRDGVPVVFHDDTPERLNGDQRTIDQIDFSELRAIASDLMTVGEALEAVGGRISVLLDTKITQPEGLAAGLDLLAPHLGNPAAVAFGTRSLEASAVVRRRLPESPVLGLFRDIGDYPALREMGGSWARLWEEDATGEAIDALRALGLKVIVMVGLPTPDGVGEITSDGMVALLRLRPDAVMLNDVRLGLAARGHLSQPNSPGG